MNRNRVHTHKYGTNELGTPVITPDGSWFRFDIYTSFATKETSRERRFAAGRDDYSPIFCDTITGRYDSRCSCCYLGFSHTLAHHQQQLAEFEPGTCPRCHVGSIRECRCTFDTGRNYPFSDGMIFCATHNKHSDIIDVDQCSSCRKPGKQASR